MGEAQEDLEQLADRPLEAADRSGSSMSSWFSALTMRSDSISSVALWMCGIRNSRKY